MAYAYLNIDTQRVFKYTVKELKIMLRGYIKRIEREQEQEKWLLWHAEALHRQKRMPTLKKWLEGDKPARKLEGKELERKRNEHEDIVNAYFSAIGGAK